MRRRPTSWRRRRTFKRLERQLREEDPELARLLSRNRAGVLPPLRVSSLPVVAYAVLAALFLGAGLYLATPSAALGGIVLTGLGVIRWFQKHRPPAGGSTGDR